MKQSFFKEKYPEIYDAVINYKKSLRKINYNNLPTDIIEYINSFNAIDCSRGKHIPIYYPVKYFDVDNGDIKLTCKGEKFIEGWNKGKTFKNYSWSYDSCCDCGMAKVNNHNFLCSYCFNNRGIAPRLKKPPLKFICKGNIMMPVIKNNKVVRVNEIPNFCLFD